MAEPLEFTYQPQPTRVVFGAGCLAKLGEEVDRLGPRRVLVLSTPGRRETGERVAAALGRRAAGVHAAAEMHVPVEAADRAREEAGRVGADGCVAVGGGSTIGLGKAVAMEYGLPVIAVPTTYSGSEMTPVWGLTERGVKRTGRDPRVLPRCVLYDPRLTLSLPVGASVSSGMNAVAHAVEALYAPDGSPVISLLAEEGARALARSLPRLASTPSDLEVRTEALYGAWLCGTCLGGTTVGLHHKLCHVLGGMGLPHAETHTVLLPHVLAFNAPAVPRAVAALARALEASDPAAELYRIATRLGAPGSLEELGLGEDDLDRAVDLATRAPAAGARPYPNPREVTSEAVRGVLRHAFEGGPPVGEGR